MSAPKKLPFSYVAAVAGCQIVTREGLEAHLLGTIYVFGSRTMIMAIRLKREGLPIHDQIVHYPVDNEGKYPGAENELHPFDLFIRPKTNDLFKLIQRQAFYLPVN